MLGSFAAEGTAPAASAAPGTVPLQQSAASHSADAVARHGRGLVKAVYTIPSRLVFLLGEDRNTNTRMGFFAVPPAVAGKVPAGNGTLVVSQVQAGEPQTKPQSGGWHTDTVTYTYTATVPAGGAVRPGRYLVSPYIPVAVTNVQDERGRHSSASVGAYVEGSLPTVTVLGGSAPAPGSSTPAPPPTTRKPKPCPTYTRADGSRIVRCD